MSLSYPDSAYSASLEPPSPLKIQTSLPTPFPAFAHLPPGDDYDCKDDDDDRAGDHSDDLGKLVHLSKILHTGVHFEFNF